MDLTKKISTHNFKAFLWHAAFLAFAKNFIDVDTVIPAMLVESGGSAMHIGLMTAIMLGGATFTQLFFAPYLSNRPWKKRFLLIGISTRIIALFGLGFLLYRLSAGQNASIIGLAFLFITLFSLAGAFANISYTDIIGKSLFQEKRKTFFSSVQVISGIIVLGAAFIAKKVLVTYEFPLNYAWMFFTGGGLLLIASGGFWVIKEVTPSKMKISGFISFFQILKKELKENNKLAYFLGFINTQGIAISFLPFIILYAKEVFNTQSADTGLFLLFKVIGIVFVSILVLLGAKKIRYNVLLYSNVMLSALLAIYALLIGDSASIKYLFIIGGIVYSLFTITMNGLLLEISGTENRALYTGFAGAGNILPAIFPLIGGSLIGWLGFNAFFILYILVVLSSAFFIFKINCRK